MCKIQKSVRSLEETFASISGRNSDYGEKYFIIKYNYCPVEECTKYEGCLQIYERNKNQINIQIFVLLLLFGSMFVISTIVLKVIALHGACISCN
jgi:hypothetical protein